MESIEVQNTKHINRVVDNFAAKHGIVDHNKIKKLKKKLKMVLKYEEGKI